ncbi:nascent polypeptide-associated complex subunit alpha-like protein 1 [Triticum dicoccoides]|uniref:nascent polypeptide-associated complex subunit alpha-like protein 1 n=1 Tax=Triticum dicoccoides TaxID=85692 RepID=UPI00188EE59A|nr:nascent polypeptide-associated complex subunit alpha-like protein 1 [Triticum dicoccoides]
MTFACSSVCEFAATEQVRARYYEHLQSHHKKHKLTAGNGPCFATLATLIPLHHGAAMEEEDLPDILCQPLEAAPKNATIRVRIVGHRRFLLQPLACFAAMVVACVAVLVDDMRRLFVAVTEGGDASGRSRSEKKCRKSMERLGMKAITGVSSVTIKLQSKTATFVLSKPDVFKSSHSETYVMFGVVKMEDMDAQLLTEAAGKFKAPGPGSVISKGEPSVAAAQDDEEVNETGVDNKDLEVVMVQASVSRSRALKALKAADGDIVSAIVELTN